MIAYRPIPDAHAESLLGRISPMTKLGIGLVWLVGLASTTRPEPPLVLGTTAIVAALLLGAIRPGDLMRALAPLWLVALVVVVSNTVFGAANLDPGASELGRVGPLRITAEALSTAAALGLRVAAIAAVGAIFALTTDSTRLADALVQQVHVPERFAYGALAAYQAIPRFAEDLTTLRQARRIRGLGGGWHPGLLLGLLVLAIRHGDRLALAMDARAFGAAPRTRYRLVAWSGMDAVVALVALVALAAALVAGAVA